MDRERQVRLAAAEVDDPELPVRAQRRNDVVDELEEAVDLAELVVAALPHRPSGVITPSSTRNGIGRPSSSRYRLRRSWPRADDRPRRRAAKHRLAEDLPVRDRRLEQALAVVGEQQSQALARIVGRQILVGDPIGRIARRTGTRPRREARAARPSPSAAARRDRGFEGPRGAAGRPKRRRSAGRRAASSPAHLVCSGRVPGTVPGTWRLQPRRLEQLQPELAARRERRDGVSEPLQRHLADDGDRRRMQHLADLEAHERCAGDHAADLVDHEP